LILHDNHYNGFGQIFLENLYPNQRFGVETVISITVSTNHNHYRITAHKKMSKDVVLMKKIQKMEDGPKKQREPLRCQGSRC